MYACVGTQAHFPDPRHPPCFSPFPRLLLQTPAEGARFVCFRGPKGELPRGEDGSYGTSLTYAKAMDPASDVIIAYKQNHRCVRVRMCVCVCVCVCVCLCVCVCERAKGKE